jgi:hypothetical protein
MIADSVCIVCRSPKHGFKALQWPPKSGHAVMLLCVCDECVPRFNEELKEYAALMKFGMELLNLQEDEKTC